MRTTIEIKGFPELILQKAVDVGLARSKTDALKISVIIMNDKYKLVDNIKEIEDVNIIKAFKNKEKKMKSKGQTYISNEEVMNKYGHLLKNK